MTDLEGVMRLLKESLAHLAGSAQDQVHYLKADAVPVEADELALEFDHVEELVPQLVERHLVSPVAARRIGEIGELFTTMSGKGKGAFWTDEALERSQIWAEVRKSAALALQELTS